VHHGGVPVYSPAVAGTYYAYLTIVIVLHSITVVCPRLLTVGDSVVLFFFSFFLFNFIWCTCNVFDVIVSP